MAKSKAQARSNEYKTWIKSGDPKLMKAAVVMLGIKQVDMAQSLGLSEARISRILNGRLAPSTNELDAIQAYLLEVQSRTELRRRRGRSPSKKQGTAPPRR